jgi:hypothetical protein
MGLKLRKHNSFELRPKFNEEFQTMMEITKLKHPIDEVQAVLVA